MRTFWQVKTVVEQSGSVTADLVKVEGFRRNPEWEVHSDEVGWDGEEFIDADPTTEGAECIEVTGKLHLDITEGPELHADDIIVAEFSVIPMVTVTDVVEAIVLLLCFAGLLAVGVAGYRSWQRGRHGLSE